MYFIGFHPKGQTELNCPAHSLSKGACPGGWLGTWNRALQGGQRGTYLFLRSSVPSTSVRRTGKTPARPWTLRWASQFPSTSPRALEGVLGSRSLSPFGGQVGEGVRREDYPKVEGSSFLIIKPWAQAGRE